MADPIKALKNDIWRKKEAIRREEGQRNEWTQMIPEIEKSIQGLTAADPELEVWQESLTTAEISIKGHDDTLEKLRNELAALEAELPQAPQAAAPKFDPEKHPLLRKAVEKPEPEQAVTFSIGDIVEARWTDKSWYKAKIQSILGAASAPKYLVRFVEYNENLTVDREFVRPLQSKRKREPEPAIGPAPTMPTTSSPHVIAGPASVNPNAQIAKGNAAVEDDPPFKKKSKIANKGQLKKRKDNWQDFMAKTAKKGPKKESMFRTSTEAGSRGTASPLSNRTFYRSNVNQPPPVGFTGSGKGMTETMKRKRYDHKADVELDDEYNQHN